MTGFLGEGLPGDARVWSKAGWSSTTRHDSAIVELAGGTRFVLVVMTYGAALGGQRAVAAFHRAAGRQAGCRSFGGSCAVKARRSAARSLIRHGRACPGHPRRAASHLCESTHVPDAPPVFLKELALPWWHSRRPTTWMAGTSPAMTEGGERALAISSYSAAVCLAAGARKAASSSASRLAALSRWACLTWP